MSDLLKRFNIIQDAIALGDEDVAAMQGARLPPEMGELAGHLAGQRYADAMVWIDEYRKQHLMLAEYTDPEIAGLQRELARAEASLAELLTEKNECLRTINAFNAAYMAGVGELLEEILRRRQEREESRTSDETDEDLNNARREYKEFRQQQAETPQTTPLNVDEQAELKTLFRQAAKKCHPDHLPDEKKEEGARMFQELEAAYREQDLARVRELWQKLQAGDWTSDAATVTDKAILRQRINTLRVRIRDVQDEIRAIHEDDIWQRIMSLAAEGVEWDRYFADTRTGLEAKLAEMIRQEHPVG